MSEGSSLNKELANENQLSIDSGRLLLDSILKSIEGELANDDYLRFKEIKFEPENIQHRAAGDVVEITFCVKNNTNRREDSRIFTLGPLKRILNKLGHSVQIAEPNLILCFSKEAYLKLMQAIRVNGGMPK